ncbi:MAG: hypothetical protein KDE53_35835, partial [Caldilineaceae bacterium]|nr:hypothetical protein [Caldilineaceae bacterium]
SEHATKLPAVGYDEGAARPHCPFNLPATGILGRAGDMVDQFGLQCEGALPAVAGGVVPANAWSHIEVRQENNRVTLSINGEVVQTLENSTTANAAPARSTLTLGGGIAGLVDEVIVQPEPKAGQQTYRDSAQVYLHLDETTGATTFVSSTAQGDVACDDTTSCVRSGLPGQVRESVQFNNDSTSPLAAGLAVALPEGGDTAFTTELWVRLSNAPTAPASLVALHETANSDRASWRLQLAPVEGETVPQLDLCDGALTVTPSAVDLVPNQWHHLALSFDATAVSQDFNLYHNGRLVHTEHLTASEPGLNCPRGNTLRLGQSYTGQMDEFSYYGRALRPSEILSHYDYQDTWYEAITTEHFQIDANPPTLKLSTGSYIQPGMHIFGVAVSDGEAGIRSVEYQDADGSWQPALTETATRGVWTFGRDVQESTTINVRATDNVGNVSTAGQAVAVDSTPPVVTMNPKEIQRTLTATGSASDSGSGVHAVSIMIVDPSGQPLSPPRAIPLVNGSWTVSQELPADVAGAFQIWASAVDQLGNGFEGFVGSVQVDNAAPLPTLDAATPDTLVGSDTERPTLRVFVTDQSAAASDAEAQTVQQVELGLLHRRDKDDSSQVLWQAMTLVNTELLTTTWALQLPTDLEGTYDISLRTVDTLGNERVVPGVWTGTIDTRYIQDNTASPAGDAPAADPEQTWQVVSTLTGNGSGVNSVTWSPDGSYLAAGTDDGIILLWAAERGESLP